jgi:hypothetical protein
LAEVGSSTILVSVRFVPLALEKSRCIRYIVEGVDLPALLDAGDIGTLETAEDMMDSSDFERSGAVILDVEGTSSRDPLTAIAGNCSLKYPLGGA